jgi:hypothetical protein
LQRHHPLYPEPKKHEFGAQSAVSKVVSAIHAIGAIFIAFDDVDSVDLVFGIVMIIRPNAAHLMLGSDED